MWRARPIFISSTFLDMQAERDRLRTHVFPHWRSGCASGVISRMDRPAARRCRWRETDEAAREIKMLKVCLAEVKRCRSFLIVLFGDRYG